MIRRRAVARPEDARRRRDVDVHASPPPELRIRAAPVLLSSGDAWSTVDLAGSILGMCLGSGDLFSAEAYASATAFVGLGNVAGTVGNGAGVVGMGAGTVRFDP